MVVCRKDNLGTAVQSQLHGVWVEVELQLARALAGGAAGMYIPVGTPAPA